MPSHPKVLRSLFNQEAALASKPRARLGGKA